MAVPYFIYIMSDAIDLITGGLGVAGNIASTLINNHHNEQLINEQNQLNLQQWNRENLYNSPSEQMKRLKAAGLNPNLMYGNGAGSLLSAPSPEMQAAHTEAPQIDPLTAAQIANLDANTRAKDAETDRENEKQADIVANLRQERINMRALVRNMDSSTELNYATITLNNARLDLDRRQLDESVRLWNSEIAKNDADTQLTIEQYSQLVALFELQKQGIRLSNREIESRIGVNRAEANRLSKCLVLMDSEINLNESNKAITDKQVQWYHVNQKLQNQLVHQQALYWQDYRKDPSRYRSKTSSHSVTFGTPQAHGSSSSSFTN